jgi:Uma2 family endonuclease
MQLTIDDAYLPATLTASPMTDEEFAAFCAQYPDHLVEMTAEGKIVIMPPNNPLTGARNLEIARQLGNWTQSTRHGIATDAASGFALPSGARLAPDAAWISKIRLRALNNPELSGAWHLCPDFVIELRSETDRLRIVRAKMLEWIDNGAQLAWLIDPDRRAVEIYRPGQDPEIRTDIEAIAGEGPVEGFLLDLIRVWDPLAD